MCVFVCVACLWDACVCVSVCVVVTAVGGRGGGVCVWGEGVGGGQ